MVETDGHSIFRLLLNPTVIQSFQAKRAKDGEKKAIVAKMLRLCKDLNTAIIWNEKEERLEIQLNVP